MSIPNQVDATPRKTLAGACAKAALRPRSADPMYDHIEAVQRKFNLSEKEMAALLGINPSNYTRRTYNAARVQRLSEDMRRLFAEYHAAGEGLTVATPTPHEQLRNAAHLAIVNLLEYLKAI